MNIFSHRGWSIGKGGDWTENSLEAFKKSAKNKNIKGVEIDIRRHPDTQEIILSHDSLETNLDYLTLSDALAYIKKQDWRILIEFKEYDTTIVNQVKKLLKKHGLQNKALLFGFKEVINSFEWNQNRDTDLGIIVEYPWQIAKTIRFYKPDTILLGWDDRLWTKRAFKIWWSIFSLKKLTTKYSVDIIVGVAESKKDISWLTKKGVSTFTADMEKVNTL